MLAWLMLGLACSLYMAMNWQLRKFGEVTYEQILFHMNISLDAESKLLASFLQNTVMTTAIVLAVVYGVSKLNWGKLSGLKKIVAKYRNYLAGGLLLCSGVYVLIKLNIGEIIADYQASSVVSDFYEKYYQDPVEVSMTAPKQKRNLVLIFIESAEATFLRKEYRQSDNKAIMPELFELAKNNLNFSHDQDIGGSIQVDGSQWTQAGLVAQTCGIPLHLPIANHNKFLPKHGYLPKAWCLTDILRQQGYNQTFLTGMEKSYAGVSKFFKSHGRPKVLSWKNWQKKYRLDDDHDKIRKRILRDEELYAETRNEISRLAKKDKPFAVIMMTMDTHGGDEYFDERNCELAPAKRYVNVYNCASKKIGKFVEWIKQQSFYKNTTVVIVNDHLVMNDTIFRKNTERRNLNVFINSAFQTKQEKGRKFMPFDMYPTIVESLGIKIDGGRLGLGVSLFGKQPTLAEQGFDTYDKFDDETSKRSLLYEYLLYGKRAEID